MLAPEAGQPWKHGHEHAIQRGPGPAPLLECWRAVFQAQGDCLRLCASLALRAVFGRVFTLPLGAADWSLRRGAVRRGGALGRPSGDKRLWE